MKISLSIGINRFGAIDAPLSGCVNDAKAMQAYFDARGYETATLLDDAATRGAVADWMAHAAARATANEVSHIALSLSSHGTQLRDLNDDEADKWDEAAVLYDTAIVNGQWGNVLLDDAVKAWLASIPKTTEVELWFDCCHAGTMSRAALQYAIRYLPPPGGRLPPPRQTLRSLNPMHVREIERAARHTRFLWEACRANQTAADAVIGGRPCGAFTWAYLSAAKTRTGRGNILANTRTLLRKAGFDQLAQLEAV
ncbi:MAG TPA: caspase family protein [Thermoflexales bacterium]|nr:caspase family protein [Thermoflexales bacterium]HQX75273.1 caspase family protein [Thermoflexales bacterium]